MMYERIGTEKEAAVADYKHLHKQHMFLGPSNALGWLARLYLGGGLVNL